MIDSAGRKRGGSLLGFLLASYLALSSAPVVLFGLLGAVLIGTSYRADLRGTMRVGLQSAAATVQRYIQEPMRMVENLAIQFNRGEALPERAETFLGVASAGAAGIRSLNLLDEERRVLASSTGLAGTGDDFSRRPFLVNARPGSTFLSAPFVNPETGGVDAGVVRIEGSLAVVGILELDTLSTFLQPLRFSPTDQIAIVDANGRFIAHTDERRLQERQVERLHGTLRDSGDDRLRYLRRDGMAYFLGETEIPGTDWAVIYYRDVNAASALAVGFAYRFALLLTALAFAAIAFVVLARSAFKRRLDALLQRIRNVESGSWLIGAASPDSWREFREIGSAFGTMAERVVEREEDLRRSEEKYRGLFVRNKAPTLIIDVESGRISDANPAALLFYGRDRETLLAMGIQDINTLDPSSVAEEMEAAALERRNHFHFRHRLADGQVKDVEVYSSPVEWEGKSSLYSIVIDVTERRVAEDRVARSLAEKEVLLREVHHRVKNNLQIMASLLSLQSLYVNDQADAELFRSSEDRILSMAAIHELLYQREDLVAVDLGEYLASLVANLSETAARKGIRITVESDRADAPPERALPLGLITNELVTNAVKYAFPNDRSDPKERRLSVILRRSEEDLELRVSDNGIGLPDAVDPDLATSLGFSLVRSLVAQIEGRVSFVRSGGFQVAVHLHGEAPEGV